MLTPYLIGNPAKTCFMVASNPAKFVNFYRLQGLLKYWGARKFEKSRLRISIIKKIALCIKYLKISFFEINKLQMLHVVKPLYGCTKADGR